MTLGQKVILIKSKVTLIILKPGELCEYRGTTHLGSGSELLTGDGANSLHSRRLDRLWQVRPRGFLLWSAHWLGEHLV